MIQGPILQQVTNFTSLDSVIWFKSFRLWVEGQKYLTAAYDLQNSFTDTSHLKDSKAPKGATVPFSLGVRPC